MGSGPYWVHEGWEAEVELDISPKITREEEVEEWLHSSLEKKKQRSGSSRRYRISTRIKGVPEERGGTTNKSRGSPVVDRPTIQRCGAVHVIQRRGACTQLALGIPSRRSHLRAVAWH